MVLPERLGHGQAPILPSPAPREDPAPAANSPVECSVENYPVFFLLDLAAELDLEVIHAYYRQNDPRGERVMTSG